MKKLLLFSLFILPFYAVGRSVGGSYISISHIISLFLSGIFLVSVGRNNMVIYSIITSWAKWFFGFLIIGFLGLLFSPYESASWIKGGIQSAGMMVMLLMGMSILSVIRKEPSFLIKLARYMTDGAVLLAAIGCVQFFVWNLTAFKSVLNFDILNSLAGTNVWREPGLTGPIYRVGSFAAEPTDYARYLGSVLGWALIRVGILGPALKNSLRRVMSVRSAYIIIFGFLASFSVNALALIITCVLLLVVSSGSFNLKYILRAIYGLAFLGILNTSLSVISEGELNTKFITIMLIFNEVDDETATNNDNLTALAIASNITVAINNFRSNIFLGGGLGSHPLAYEKFAPEYVYKNSTLTGLNADDAASLLLRLLSETGLIGSFLFIGGIMKLLRKARNVILDNINRVNPNEMSAISIGLLASTGSVLVLYLLRTAHYYDPVFWVLISLTASIPIVLKKDRVVNRDPKQGERL